MRAVIFSWEFPPRVVGQLADYVRNLVLQLIKHRVETHVVTYHDYLTGDFVENEGIKTHRVTNPIKTHISVLTWVLTLNPEVERAAANIYYGANKHLDLIDVHEWHFIPAAVTLKKALGIPFIYSVESLEDHRSHATNSPFNMAIKSIEWLGMYEAQKIVMKSDWMANEAIRIYKVPEEKIKVIPPKTSTWLKTILETYKSLSGKRANRCLMS